MPKSKFADAVDEIQAELEPFFKRNGFRRHGRTFNATTPDDLTWVANIQMGPSDPPGTTYSPGLRENRHGLFTVNLGVYVPEVARHHGGTEVKLWAQPQHCSIRARLGALSMTDGDLWWPATLTASMTQDVLRRLVQFGMPFLERFSTRQRILDEFAGVSENRYLAVPRIVSAILLTGRGDAEEARRLLSDQSRETSNRGHAAYVRELARRLGLGELAG